MQPLPPPPPRCVCVCLGGDEDPRLGAAVLELAAVSTQRSSLASPDVSVSVSDPHFLEVALRTE